MLIYFDHRNKIIYIMAPKCGTTTIAKMLNVNLHIKYDEKDMKKLNNSEYKKIIIIRKSVIDRFLSGFYEDLFNNTCYDNMHVTFSDYLLFLYECFKKRIPNVNNMNIYNNKNVPVWFGNCSGVTRNITDDNGNFKSHLMSQKYAINNIVNNIKCKNVQVIDINDLSNILPTTEKCNVKKKIEEIPNGFDVSSTLLSTLKSKRIIISDIFLDEKQKMIILDMYKEDLLFFNELEQKFKLKI